MDVAAGEGGDGSTLEAAGPTAPAPVDIRGSAVDQSAVPAPAYGPIADGATQPSDSAAITNGTARVQGGTTGGKGREPGTSDDLLSGQDLGGVSPLVVLSIAFLITGLGLFAMRWTARRFGG